jgi:hypothetical protein
MTGYAAINTGSPLPAAHRYQAPRPAATASVRYQPQPHVRLDREVQCLDQDQPPAHPALVAIQPARDLGLRELVVAV